MVPIKIILNYQDDKTVAALDMPRDKSSMTWNNIRLRIIGFNSTIGEELLESPIILTVHKQWFQGRIYNVLSSALVLLLLWRASLGKVVLEYRPSLTQCLRVLVRGPRYIKCEIGIVGESKCVVTGLCIHLIFTVRFTGRFTKFGTVELKIVWLALSGGKPSSNVLSGGAVSAIPLSGRMLSDSALSDAALPVN